MNGYSELIKALDALIYAHIEILGRYRCEKPNARHYISSAEYSKTVGITTGLEIARGLAVELEREPPGDG